MAFYLRFYDSAFSVLLSQVTLLYLLSSLEDYVA